jgi:flagellar hook protein FlgE
MGIFDALNTAVTGLQAQSFALQNISGNIANSQTTAYKGTNTEFEDLLADQGISPGQQTAGSVFASSSSTITVQGDIQSTSTATNMAINGDGFFVVEKPTGFTDGVPSFNGVNYYTRAGNFTVQDGYLVNSAGYYLMGVPIDPATDNPVGSSPQLLQFQNSFLPAQATSTITYGANLPTNPTTTDTNPNVANSDLLNPIDYISNPLLSSGPAIITGLGAGLTPDAPATVTGTTATSYTVPATGSTLSINGVTVAGLTQAAPIPPAALVALINAGGGTGGVTAALSNGDITLTSANATTPITLAGDSGALTALGLSATTTEPTNLLTQKAVTDGQTLVVDFGTSTNTITFGTAAGDVQSMAQLETALSGLSGGTGSLDPTDGDIRLTAAAGTSISLAGSTATLSEFGIQTTSEVPPTGTVIGSDVNTFLAQSVGGGSITAYDNAGSPANIQFRWAQVAPNTWNMFYQTNSSATGNQPAWTNVGTTFTFGANGSLSPPVSSISLPNVSVNGVAVGNIQLNFGSGGLTQFADTNGTVNVNELQQNGYAAGSLQTLAVSSEGNVTGAYSNGQTIDLAQVTLASFSGEDFLQNVSGGAYAQTDASGVPLYNASGTITPSSLEGSNTDIADEFTQLIVTQQAYSVNARVITTANQMLQVVTNMFS